MNKDEIYKTFQNILNEEQCEITLFFNCLQCSEELPAGQSPQDYRKLSVGLTNGNKALQIWCDRHSKPLVTIPITKKQLKLLGNPVCADCGEAKCPTNMKH